MAKTGLVTVLYNSDDVLEGFFKSISAQSYKNYILYLVDNSENDNTDAIIAKLVQAYPVAQYLHIKSEGNIGVAAGNNTGIRKALADGCDYVLLLNNDIEIEQDNALEKMVSLCEVKEEKLLVPKIFYHDSHKLWMAGGYMDKWRALGVHYGYKKQDVSKYNLGKYITYAPTCFMIIAKEVFIKVGYMDEKYFAYYDDTDYVLRATRAGYKLYYEPSVSILHKVSSSAGGDVSPFYIYYSNRNKVYFIRKNLEGIKRLFAISYTLLSRLAFWFLFNRAGKKNLIKGLKDGFRLKILQEAGYNTSSKR
ncbi:MAG TPA: glycosyltransferase family 2 protein [Chitinophagaceae bacterium]|nr:glycosyltransferase family 2 protein [Chitinophagaceae bacterium]